MWFRRVVPAGYQRATVALEGTSPLLMSSGETDPDSAEARAFELLASKRGKSLDDRARLRELEWAARLYLDAEIGPYIPGLNTLEMLRQAATKWRKGAELQRSLITTAFRLPVLYDGPRDQQGLWDGGYRLTRLVANSGAGSGRVHRCRPMFEQWSLVFEIAFDPEELDLDFLHLVVERSQKYGLGDYRPVFGSFEASLVEGELHKAMANGSALKPRVRQQLKAHEAFVRRITKNGGPAPQ